MASVFKRSNGRNVPYTVQFRDHLGKRRTQTGFTDKQLSEQLAARLESEARLRSSGLIDVDQERIAETKQSAIDVHVAAFEESISEQGTEYIRHTKSRLNKIITGAGITSLAELTAETVTTFLRSLRRSKDLGPRTFNHYLQAIDAFCNWCVMTKRLNSNPLAGVARLNVDVDVRHKRRALTGEEFGMLVQSARGSAQCIQRFDGEQRARIYLMSYLTGLRQKELGSLTPRSFDLKSDPPTVTLEAATSKHRKKDVLPLHPELAAALPEWLKGLKPSDKLFPNLERKKAWLMVKRDLERVEIPYENEDGIADFHAAGRHTHITELLRNGATLPETQKLARHSDIKMTMRYVHIGLSDQARAIANLPASALHGRCISGDFDGQSVSTAGNASRKRKRLTPCQNRRLGVVRHRVTSDVTMEAGGIEPPSCCPTTKASTCVVR